MSSAVSLDPSSARLALVRKISAALAVVVALDAVWVRAPFIVVLGVPFAIAAWRFREGRVASTIGLTLWSVVFALIGANFILSNGLHGPEEAGQVSKVINPGDFAFAYIGAPLAAWLAVQLVLAWTSRRRAKRPTAALPTIAIVVLTLIATVAMGTHPASAAGGNGMSLCSNATGPTGPYDLGAAIRSHQPFYGDNNPGFAGPGVSPFCKP